MSDLTPAPETAGGHHPMNDTMTLYLPDDKLRENIAAAGRLLRQYGVTVEEAIHARAAFAAAEDKLAAIEDQLANFGIDPVALVYGREETRAKTWPASAFPPVTATAAPPAPVPAAETLAASVAMAGAEEDFPVVTPEDAGQVFDQMAEELDRPAPVPPPGPPLLDSLPETIAREANTSSNDGADSVLESYSKTTAKETLSSSAAPELEAGLTESSKEISSPPSSPGRKNQPLQAPEVVEGAPPARAAFARALSAARIEAGMSSRMLSDKVSKYPSDISTWERGKGLPGAVEIAQALAAALDAPHLERLWHAADRERTAARGDAARQDFIQRNGDTPTNQAEPPAPAAEPAEVAPPVVQAPSPKEVTAPEAAPSAAVAAEALQVAIRDGRQWFRSGGGYDVHKHPGLDGAPDFYAAVPKGEVAEKPWIPVLRCVWEVGQWQEIPLNPSGKARGA